MINSGRLQYFVQYSSSPYLKPVHIESLSPTNLVTVIAGAGDISQRITPLFCEVLSQSGPLFSIIMYDTLIYFLEYYVEYYTI